MDSSAVRPQIADVAKALRNLQFDPIDLSSLTDHLEDNVRDAWTEGLEASEFLLGNETEERAYEGEWCTHESPVVICVTFGLVLTEWAESRKQRKGAIMEGFIDDEGEANDPGADYEANEEEAAGSASKTYNTRRQARLRDPEQAEKLREEEAAQRETIAEVEATIGDVDEDNDDDDYGKENGDENRGDGEDDDDEDDEDEGITYGDLQLISDEDIAFCKAKDNHILVDGVEYHYPEYFGKDWLNKIDKLYSVAPMEPPAGMVQDLMPHDYQRRGAGQLDYLTKSNFKAAILGDEMGLGKTVQALMVLHQNSSMGRVAVVVAPLSVCQQWVETDKKFWEPEHRLKMIHLSGKSISATEIISGDFDVIVVSYGTVLTNFKATRQNFAKNIDLYRKEKRESKETPVKPTRPTSPLFSELYKLLDRPFTYLVLDEVQVINKRHLLQYEAVEALANMSEAVIMLSGTLAHNKWHGFSAYLGLVRGLPFKTDNMFLYTFANAREQGGIDKPTTEKRRLLQRCLQAFVIRRPGTELDNMPGKREMYTVEFTIGDLNAKLILDLLETYKKIAQFQPGKRKKRTKQEDDSALRYLVQSQLLSIHPLLFDKYEEAKEKMLSKAKESGKGKKRAREPESPVPIPMKEAAIGEPSMSAEEEFDAAVKESIKRGTLLDDGPRLMQIVSLYRYCLKTYPGEKMIFFSRYLRHLKLVKEALKLCDKVDALLFDGELSIEERKRVRDEFVGADASRPLLITAGAGKFYLS